MGFAARGSDWTETVWHPWPPALFASLLGDSLARRPWFTRTGKIFRLDRFEPLGRARGITVKRGLSTPRLDSAHLANHTSMAGRGASSSWRRIPVSESESATDDLELMRAVARQDRRAFKILYDRYAPRLGSYLLKVLKRPELVDEAMNDTMLAVWQNAGRFDPGQGHLLTWLFGIAHHKGLKTLRQAGRSRAEIPFDTLPPPVLDDAEERDDASPAVAPHDPERTVLGWELGQALRWALDRLSPDHRAVIELTFGEERSYPEIAAIVDCPVNTVKTRVFHARKQLARLLAERGHGDFAKARE